MIRLRTLGTLDLRDDETGRALRSVLAQPKRLALLAYLALARPRGAYERDTLLALFWPEASESRARNALNQALFFLLRRLGDEAIRSVGTALELDRERVWCDAVAFGARRETEPRAALELYRGELMRGFHLSGCPGFERWVDGERERLRGLAVETALDLAAREAGADNAVGAVSWSRKAARWAPYQERVARELITRLEEAGDLSGALKAFEAVRRRCVQELGSAPGGEVQGIADGIRRRMRSEAPSGDADPRPRTVGGGPGSPPTPSPARHSPLGESLLLGGLIVAGAAAVALLGPERERIAGADARPAPALPRIAVAARGDPPLASSALRRAELAAGTIASELGASGLLEVVRVREGDPVPAGDGGTGAGSVSGEESGAGPDVDFAVSVGGVSEGGTVVMSATITDARRGTVLDRVAETTGSGAPEPELDRFVDRVAGSVAAFADPRMALWIGSSGRPPTLDAYRAFSDGLDLYYRSATSVENFRDLKTAAALRFREADSPEGSFPAAGAWAFWAGRWGEGETSGPRFHRLVKRRQGLAHFDRALVDYIDASTFRGDHEAAYDALRRVVELSGCPEFESGLAEEAVRLNRPRYALCLLEAIDVEGGWCFQEGGRDDPDIPGSNARGYWLLLARHIVGDYEGELRDVRRIRERTADVILPEARALAALGRGGEAVGVLTASVPDPTSRVAAVVAAELARHGDTEAANRILRRYMERFRNLDRTEQIGVVARDAYRAAFAFHLAGAAEELIPLIQEARSTGRVPNPDWERAIVGVLHAAAGNRERALEILRWLDGACVAECPEATPRLIRGAARYMQGAIAAHIGQRTDALLALRDGYPSQVLNIYYDPFLRPLWEDPAFVELLRPQG